MVQVPTLRMENLDHVGDCTLFLVKLIWLIDPSFVQTHPARLEDVRERIPAILGAHTDTFL